MHKANKAIFLIHLLLVFFAASHCNYKENKKLNDFDSTDMNRKVELVGDLGETLFKTNCVVCHRINQRNCGGPNIVDASERWQDKKLFKAYIKNSKAVREKNEYAKKMWLEYGKIESHDFPKLSDADINSIIIYLELQKHKKG